VYRKGKGPKAEDAEQKTEVVTQAKNKALEF
jgi:hypothetical protein